jgi:hypothetical protein
MKWKILIQTNFQFKNLNNEIDIYKSQQAYSHFIQCWVLKSST